MIAPQARAQIAATLVFAASVLLVAMQAPLWTVAVALGCCGWRLAVATGRLAMPRPRNLPLREDSLLRCSKDCHEEPCSALSMTPAKSPQSYSKPAAIR